MAGNWIKTTLGDVLTLQRGFDLPAQNRRSGTVPVVASTGIVGSHDEALVKSPGVVIGRSGSIGGAQFITNDFWPLNTTLWVKDFRGHYPRFVYYLLSSIDFKGFNVGSGVPTLNRNHIHSLPVSIPSSYSEQKAIAHILGTLDDKIELNQQMNRNLEVIASAIFKSWFVDFDPVRAKMEGRQSVGIDAAIAALFPDSFENSLLGEIPTGWRVFELSKLCRVGRGASPRPINDPRYLGGSIPWIKIADATKADGPFLFETKEGVTEAGRQKSVFLKKGSLILSNSATCGLPIFLEIDGCIHDGWLYFENLKLISQNYLYQVLSRLTNYLIHIADGSVQKNLNTKLVGSQNILVPNSGILSHFETLTSVIFNKVRENGRESRTLAAIRDALLPKLMSGEIRVKQAEKILEDVA